jgi:hypothetical protein
MANTDGRVNKLVTVFERSCTQDKSVIALAPRHPHLHIIKILPGINFWLLDKWYRDAALVPITGYVTGISNRPECFG